MALESKPLFHPEVIRQEVRSLTLPERVGHATQNRSNKLLAVNELASDTWVGEVKRIRGKKTAADAAGVQTLRAEYTRTIDPARALVLETVDLERTLSDLVNQAYGLTHAQIDLIWETAPPRMPITWPAR